MLGGAGSDRLLCRGTIVCVVLAAALGGCGFGDGGSRSGLRDAPNVGGGTPAGEAVGGSAGALSPTRGPQGGPAAEDADVSDAQPTPEATETPARASLTRVTESGCCP